MKRVKFILLLLGILLAQTGKAQSTEAQQLLLNWEKLKQLKEILDAMYTGYKILDKGYTTIKNIAEGNYSLHQAFLDGLMAVNPSVRQYKRIPFIIDYQKLLVDEYRRANARFRSDPNLTFEELEYLASVYDFLFQASLRNLDDLFMIITANNLRMTDEERLQAIDVIFYDIESQVAFLNYFNNSTQLVAIQRARSRNDIRTMRQVYGINPNP